MARTSSSAAAVLAALVLLLASCGGKDGDPAAGPAPALPATAAPEGKDAPAGSPDEASPPIHTPVITGSSWGELRGMREGPRMAVQIACDKSLQPLGDPTTVQVEVRNGGEQPVSCTQAVHDLLSVSLEIRHGDTLAEYVRIQKDYFSSILERTKGKDYLPAVVLSPGEATTTNIRFLLPEAGTYGLRAVYRGFGPSNPLFYRSDWKEIEVEPDGDKTSLNALLHTDLGDLEFAFHPAEALATVTHFLTLVSMRFYDNTRFHRVERDFVLQGGDPLGTGQGGPGFYIPQEFNRRPHLEGAVSMVRLGTHVDTAGSQFFICFPMDTENQKLLDGQYTVFATVVRGFETARKIGEVEVDGQKQPVEPVRITQVSLVKR